jgi:hypothetical protein
VYCMGGFNQVTQMRAEELESKEYIEIIF